MEYRWVYRDPPPFVHEWWKYSSRIKQMKYRMQVLKNQEKINISPEGRKEGNVLFNDALNTFYLRLYGIIHMVKGHSDSEKGNLLPPHGATLSD